MSNWNLTGQAPTSNQPRIRLNELEDGTPVAYTGEIIAISDVYRAKKYNSDEEVDKIRIDVGIDNNGEKAAVPYFVNFVASKGSGNYNSSKLFELLEKANLVGQAQEEGVEGKTDEEKLAFLRNNLAGQLVKFLVKTAKKGTDDAYSVVKEITKIWKANQGPTVDSTVAPPQ